MSGTGGPNSTGIAVGRTEATHLSSGSPTSDIPLASVGRRGRDGPLGPTYALIWAVVIAFLWWGYAPDVWTLAGSALITVSGLYALRPEPALKLR